MKQKEKWSGSRTGLEMCEKAAKETLKINFRRPGDIMLTITLYFVITLPEYVC